MGRVEDCAAEDDPARRGSVVTLCHAAWCVVNSRVTLNVHITSPGREIYSDSLYGTALKQFTLARDHEYRLKLIESALMLAGQARFEHGEKPQITMGNALM